MDDTKLLEKHMSTLSLTEFKWSWTLSERWQLLYFLWIMVRSVAGLYLHCTSCSSCPQQRISRNIVCSLTCHLTTLQLSISWMAVYLKYLFVLPEKCITHWWSDPPNEKEATSPKHSIEKEKKKIWGEGKENSICAHGKCSLERGAAFLKI